MAGFFDVCFQSFRKLALEVKFCEGYELFSRAKVARSLERSRSAATKAR